MKASDPTILGSQFLELGANLGKTILGDNKVGNFVDNWINPIRLANDLATWKTVLSLKKGSD